MSTFFQQTAQANTHECNHLSPLLEGIAEGTTVYADKGYDSKENRQHLKEHQLLDGIMRKARAAYFGLIKVSAQSHLKAMCLNLLKAANRLSVSVAA